MDCHKIKKILFKSGFLLHILWLLPLLRANRKQVNRSAFNLTRVLSERARVPVSLNSAPASSRLALNNHNGTTRYQLTKFLFGVAIKACPWTGAVLEGRSCKKALGSLRLLTFFFFDVCCRLEMVLSSLHNEEQNFETNKN